MNLEYTCERDIGGNISFKLNSAPNIYTPEISKKNGEIIYKFNSEESRNLQLIRDIFGSESNLINNLIINKFVKVNDIFCRVNFDKNNKQIKIETLSDKNVVDI